MKNSPVLRRFQIVVMTKVDPAILHPDGTWIHYDRLSLYHLHLTVKAPPLSQVWKRALMLDSIPLLRLIWRDARKFTNLAWCPNTAIGDYIWSFQLEMLQQLIWMRPDFVEGFSYGSALGRRKYSPAEPARDRNPCFDRARNDAWDTGYIFALEQDYRPKAFTEWMRWLQQLPSPHPLSTP